MNDGERKGRGLKFNKKRYAQESFLKLSFCSNSILRIKKIKLLLMKIKSSFRNPTELFEEFKSLVFYG